MTGSLLDGGIISIMLEEFPGLETGGYIFCLMTMTGLLTASGTFQL